VFCRQGSLKIPTRIGHGQENNGYRGFDNGFRASIAAQNTPALESDASKLENKPTFAGFHAPVLAFAAPLLATMASPLEKTATYAADEARNPLLKPSSPPGKRRDRKTKLLTRLGKPPLRRTRQSAPPQNHALPIVERFSRLQKPSWWQPRLAWPMASPRSALREPRRVRAKGACLRRRRQPRRAWSTHLGVRGRGPPTRGIPSIQTCTPRHFPA
jgi:hypothetical protein